MLVLADGTRLAQLNSISNLTHISLVMGLKLGDPAKNFFVNWMND